MTRGLFVVAVLLGSVSAAQDTPARISSADFPKVSQRVHAFEERINSRRVEDREHVVHEVGHGWRLPDAELVRFFKRVMKQDGDAWVRGQAVKTLYDMWVPLEPSELPATFYGFHRGQLLDRQREDLAEQLIAELKKGELPGGYAAYAVGLLRLKKAVPDLNNLAESKNVFVRYSAGRALLQCGDKEKAAAILKTIMNHPVPPNATFDEVEDPYYQALACRAYMEVAPAEKQAAIQRLITLMQELESWTEINAQGRLDTARRTLATVSGQYFVSSQDARAWQARQAGR